MDCRINPAAAFGMNLGEAHVIRNAGGSAVEALRSIIVSEQELDTKRIFVIKHTECGMLGLTDEKISEHFGDEAVAELKSRGMEFLGIPVEKDEVNKAGKVTKEGGVKALKRAVEQDVDFLLNKTKLVAEKVKVSGWLYDVKTGKVENVVPAKPKR